jgi:hypothetical protein
LGVTRGAGFGPYRFIFGGSGAASHRLMHLDDIAFWVMKKDLMPFFREGRPII